MGKAFKLRNGMLLLSTEAPGGIYNSAQLKKIAALADGESAIVKATEDQRLALLVKPDMVKKVATELKAVGLGLRNYQDGLHQPVACLGKHCPEVQQDALATAMDLSQELVPLTADTPLRIGVNGCARCCVPTHTLDVSIIGDSNGYRVSLGGKNSQIPEMATFMAEGVPAAKLPKLIAKVVQVYKGLAQKDETLQETMERAGSRKFIEALAPYSQDAAAGGDDPFGGLDAGDGADGGGGPAVETPKDEMAFDKEPAVEDFDAESLEGSAEDTLAVEDLAEAPLDEPLALEGSDGDALVSEELDGDFAIEGDSMAEGLAEDSLGGEVAAGDEDLGMTEELESETMTPASRQAPALVSDDDDLSLDAFEEETVGNETSRDDGELELAELETEDLEVSASSGGDAVDIDELPEDTVDLDFDSKTAAAATAGGDDDFESIDPSGGAAPSAPAAATKPVSAAAKTSAPAPSKPAAVAPVLEDELLDEDAAGAEEVEGEAADEFEEKLNASIAEEESIPVAEDVHSHTRLEAMKLVEADDGAVHEDLQVDGFDDLGIDDEVEDLASSSEEAVAPAPAPVSGSARKTSGSAAAPHEFELIAMEFTREGRLSLRFSTGAAIMLDPKTLRVGTSRELTVAGKKVLINSQDGGFSVEVDGVGVFLPLAAA
jgi:hypothetical protein